MNLEILTDVVPRPDQLRDLREAMGLSQNELGRALGLSPLKAGRIVREWESGATDNGKVITPTPTAWSAFRYLAIISLLYRRPQDVEYPPGDLRQFIPECVL